VTSTGALPRVAVLAGATGLVGGHCLPLLLQSTHYHQVIALVRRPLDLQHPKLRQIVADFERLPLLPEFAGTDVFCTIGTTMRQAGSREAFRKVDFDAELAYATTVSQAGARQFILVSSVGANAHSSTFYLQIKGELEEAVKALPFRSIHIFRPSFLAGDRSSDRTAERLSTTVAKALDFAFIGKFRNYSPVEADDLAAAMLAVARKEDPGVHIHEYEQILSLAKS
jgi:uncharacterized protein YbjT (DUF2867 family)